MSNNEDKSEWESQANLKTNLRLSIIYVLKKFVDRFRISSASFLEVVGFAKDYRKMSGATTTLKNLIISRLLAESDGLVKSGESTR
jgi:hypothetical protein